MEVPVERHGPSVLDGLLHFLTEILQSNILRHAKAQGVSDVVYVVGSGQLRNTTLQHQREQVDEEVTMVTELHECFFTSVFESTEIKTNN